jgi:hypothetical protein
MARRISWRDRIPEIRRRVENSVVETWSRRDIERTFEIKRAAALLLLRAIGEVQNVGGTHLVARAALLSFLEGMEQAEDPEVAQREKMLLAEPAPRPRFLKFTLPEELRSVMVRDLPMEISLSPGRLEIVGENAEQILERLVLLSKALQNDLGTAAEMLNPPPPPSKVQDEDLTALFSELRQRERAFDNQ